MRPKRIPIAAAKRIAEEYGYEQVVIYARKTGEDNGEWMTTYGKTKDHCGIAARIGESFRRWMGWDSLVPSVIRFMHLTPKGLTPETFHTKAHAEKWNPDNARVVEVAIHVKEEKR